MNHNAGNYWRQRMMVVALLLGMVLAGVSQGTFRASAMTGGLTVTPLVVQGNGNGQGGGGG